MHLGDNNQAVVCGIIQLLLREDEHKVKVIKSKFYDR
jgi:hypothetical protein